MKSSFAFVLAAAALVLAGCGRNKVVERYPKGDVKLMRTYGWGGKVTREQAFYFNGHKERDAHFKDSVLDGDYTEFWHNGQKRAQGRYAAGKKQGEWEFFFNQYVPASKGVFKDDQKEGEWLSFWENGTLRSRGSYRNGNDTGVRKEWNNKGELLLENSCFEANDTGRYASFHANRTPKEDYPCVKGRPVGPYARKDPDGTVVERGTFDSLGRKEGLWETFHAGGAPASRASYHMGLQEDSALAWYADGVGTRPGSVKERGFYKDGTGELLGYDSLGHRLMERRQLKNGLPEGESRTYYPDGKPKSLVVYKDGQPAEMRRWHPNGKVWAEGAFLRGQREGDWKQFDERGRPKETSHYKNGVQEGDQLFYDSLGRLVRTQRYEHGYPASGKIPAGLGNTAVTGALPRDTGAGAAQDSGAKR